jgi:osmotically-inducible protein OsmY
MKINLPIAGLLLGVWLLPVTGYTADTSTSAIPPSANETPGGTPPNPSGTTQMRRSAHPVDDSVVTTKIKGRFLKDSQVRIDNIEIETINGAVRLFGTARTRAKAAHAVALARQVEGVQSVKNEIQITAPEPVAARDRTYDRDRTADNRRSDQPVDDTWITTKIKAKFVKDKQVRARDVEVKTVNGAVELTGTARTRAEAKRAVTLARQVKGVQSVRNDIEIASPAPVAARETTNDRDRTADRRRSDQPVDDSWITTKVKAKLLENKVSATNVHVKTLDGVVELTGTAKSMDESSKAASLAGGIKGVKSVTNDIKVN